MNIKTAKLKHPPANGTSLAKRAKSAKESPAKSGPKKSVNERLIEKYGIDDSDSAKLLLKAWNKSYENRNKRID